MNIRVSLFAILIFFSLAPSALAARELGEVCRDNTDCNSLNCVQSGSFSFFRCAAPVASGSSFSDVQTSNPVDNVLGAPATNNNTVGNINTTTFGTGTVAPTSINGTPITGRTETPSNPAQVTRTPNNPVANTRENVQLINPLQGGGNLESFLNSILAVVIRIGTIVVILMMVYVGYLFVAARGEPGKITTARQALLWTVVGALILLGAQVIAIGIRETVQALSVGQ